MGDDAGIRVSIALGGGVSSPTGEIAVTSIATTPGAYRDGDGAIGGDLALLTLASAAVGITPAPVATAAPTESLALQIVGFGYTRAGSMGTLGDRNEGAASVVSVTAGTFTSEGASWTCTGDSGGPAFRASDGAIIGVTSIGPRRCPASTSIYTRLDQHLDLLSTAGVDVGTEPDASITGDSSTVGGGSTIDAAVDPAPPAGGCGRRMGGPRRSDSWLAVPFVLGLLARAGRRKGACSAERAETRRPSPRRRGRLS